MAVGF